jgi:hypothetical protein
VLVALLSIIFLRVFVSQLDSPGNLQHVQDSAAPRLDPLAGSGEAQRVGQGSTIRFGIFSKFHCNQMRLRAQWSVEPSD